MRGETGQLAATKRQDVSPRETFTASEDVCEVAEAVVSQSQLSREDCEIVGGSRSYSEKTAWEWSYRHPD